MKLTRMNQDGIGLVVAMAAVAVLMAGFVGYTVYSKQADRQKARITSFDECVAAGNPVMESYPEQCAANGKTFVNDRQQSEDGTSAEAAESPSSDWLLYESPGKEFRIRLADGWQLTRYDKSASLYHLANDLAIRPGIPAVVKEILAGRDASTGFSIVFRDNNELKEHPISPRGAKQVSLKTETGLEIEKYIYVQPTEPDAIDIPKGAKEYQYYVKSEKGMVQVSYSFAPGDTDYHKEVENVLPTVQIL